MRIKSFLQSSIANLSLRGLSMLAKFLLMIFIGKYLSTSELGEYGLFMTTVTLSIYLLGLDFYTYNTREILAKNKEERLSLIRDQFIFHLIVYTIVLPLLITIFLFNIITFKYIVYFYLILIFEHISQELYRLYTTLQKPIFANLLLFIRTGIWVYAIALLWYMQIKETMNLETVWLSWVGGAFLSIIIGIVFLLKEYKTTSLRKAIDWQWIKNGVKVSIPFFIGTIAYKVIEFSDRYMIDYYMTKPDVGVYTFFSGIANVVNIIVFTTVIMVYYPLLVEQYEGGKINLLQLTIKKFFFNTTIMIFTSILIISVSINYLIEFIDKIEFLKNIKILWILLITNIFLNFSFIPHYILYILKKDTVIMNATIIGAIINLISNLILIPLFGLLGAAYGTLTSYLSILIIKYIYANQYFLRIKK